MRQQEKSSLDNYNLDNKLISIYPDKKTVVIRYTNNKQKMDVT